MTAPDFLDRLVGIFQNAIASTQENAQLKAENAQLKAENTDLASKLDAATAASADLQTRLDATTASLNEDEIEKANTAAKLASLEQLASQLESISNSATPVAA
ncbi:hypothetical protein NIES4072_31370 [Nostoc commune NIES-4072]|uniref:Uncharacterized protein n=1 Tax=Nostoc commune NIES-4072 TaxID=2005467 RepID=A0A2R5FN53_NOSCO|nr:hypothetical protein [Nostoc commune]BBD69530.1 hypothetical protein NIES4070_59390 [Nostoc commune HK-02]GBG19469.1 hypothetical protein NIES4072_31370 [Nostoc commune NIES-4072]